MMPETVITFEWLETVSFCWFGGVTLNGFEIETKSGCYFKVLAVPAFVWYIICNNSFFKLSVSLMIDVFVC